MYMYFCRHVGQILPIKQEVCEQHCSFGKDGEQQVSLAREPLSTAYRVMTIVIDWLICTNGGCLVIGVGMNRIQ